MGFVASLTRLRPAALALVVVPLLIGSVVSETAKASVSAGPAVVMAPMAPRASVRLAQATPVAPPAAGAPDLWTRVCEQNICILRQFVRSDTGEMIMATFGLNAGRKPMMVITTPASVLIQPGLALKVDDKDQTTVPFASCEASGCKATLEMPDAFLQALRAGTGLRVGWIDADGKQKVFPVNLSGFSAGWRTVSN